MPTNAEQYFNFIQSNTWTTPLMFGLFAVSLISLLFDRDGKKHHLFWYCGFLLLVVIYNPWFWFGLISSVYDGDYLVLLRFLWLIPAYLIMVYFLTKVIFIWKKKWVRALALCMAGLFIWMAGTRFHPSLFTERTNWYKISPEAIEISEMIIDDMSRNTSVSEHPAVLEIYDTENYYVNDTSEANWLHFGIRQYTAAFALLPVQITSEEYERETFEISDYITELTPYVICADSDILVGQVEKLGYTVLGSTDDHVVFCQA